MGMETDDDVAPNSKEVLDIPKGIVYGKEAPEDPYKEVPVPNDEVAVDEKTDEETVFSVKMDDDEVLSVVQENANQVKIEVEENISIPPHPVVPEILIGNPVEEKVDNLEEDVLVDVEIGDEPVKKMAKNKLPPSRMVEPII